jgi:hypothetical protein
MTTKLQPANIDSTYDYSSLVVSAYQTANGAFSKANNSLNVQSGGTITGNVTIAGNFVPESNLTYNLGSTTARWKDLYLSGNTIDLGGAQIKSDPNTGGFVFVPTPSANTPNPTALFISSTGTLTTVQTTAGEITGANLTLAAANTVNATPVDVSINVAFAQANAAFLQANAAFTTANAASPTAAFLQANAAFGTANSGASYANSAFTKANNALPSTGGTISGSITVTQDTTIQGNLYVQGNTTSFNTDSFTINDSLIILGIGNYTTDLVDIGFAAHYNAGTNAHAGIIRDSDTKTWTFFEGYTPEVSPNNNIILTHSSFSYANVRAKDITGNLIANTVTVNGVDLYNYATNAYTKANTPDSTSNTASTTATAAFLQANAVFTQSNNYVWPAANSAGSYANAAFTKANTALANTSGTTFGGDLSITGNVTITNTISLASVQDKTITGTPAAGTTSYSYYTGTVFDVTPSAAWTVNITSVPTTTNRATVATFIITQGATPYVPAAFQIDGAAQTVKWINNTAPTGTANKVDVISYSMIRTSGGAWIVLGQTGAYG